tara:strand:- start:1548 stop:1919 length:372 start_codon:yes stop_codon:yes gene_type:complete
MSNPTLGVIDCPTCNTEGAEVRQTKRRGARLYWQCSECGLNQPTGAKIQAKLWQETQWSEGAAPLRPGNVSSEAVATEQEIEFDPNETAARSEPQPTSQPSKAKGLGVLLLASLGLGVFLSAR